MATEDPILRQQDNITTDHRYRGYVYDLQRPRIPITGPIGFRADDRKYPLPSSLVRGNPVLPPNPAKGFFFGSENIRDLSGEERRENKINLRLLDKTSAEVRRSQRAAEEQTQFLKLHKEARQRQERKRRQEQDDDLKQLKTYFPFGKSGYGAPRSGNLGRTKTLWNEGGVGMVMDHSNPSLPRSDWKKSVAPGDPGRPRVRRYEDDQMRRYAVSRETAMAYKKDLDQLQAIKKQNDEKVKSLDTAREKDILNYDPFGKPGAGAPNRDDRDEQLILQTQTRPYGLQSPGCQICVLPSLSPLRLDQSHASMRRSMSLSYMNNPVDAKRAEHVQERKDSDKETQKEETFGRLQVGHRYKHVTPINKEDPPEYDPWGRDLPRVDSRGNARRYPRAGDNGIYEFVNLSVPGEVFPRKHIGGGGEPLMGEHGEKLTKRMGNLTTILGARRSENIPRVATPDQIKRSIDGKSPWGKPGAGAPLKDDEGNVVKNTKGTINKERQNLTQTEASRRGRAKELYRSQLQEGMVLQRQLRDHEKDLLMQETGDVPSWFSKGKVGRPTRDPETGLIQPQKRVMSDVTAQKLAANRPRNVESYYRELKEHADERKTMRLKEKQRVEQLEAKPFPYKVVAPWAID